MPSPFISVICFFSLSSQKSKEAKKKKKTPDLRLDYEWQKVQTCDQIVFCAFNSFWVEVQTNAILVPRARRFLVTWSGNEGLWKQPLPDVRKFLTSGRACAEVTNITAHAHNVFLSLTAPLGKKFYFLSSLQRVACLGCFENGPLHSTWIHW